jgi:hypothetical protein
VAGVSRPAELAAQSVRARKLRGLLSGEQHQSYVLYDRAEGSRIAVYVPEELVPQVQRGWTTAALCRICCTRRHRDTSKR